MVITYTLCDHPLCVALSYCHTLDCVYKTLFYSPFDVPTLVFAASEIAGLVLLTVLRHKSAQRFELPAGLLLCWRLPAARLLRSTALPVGVFSRESCVSCLHNKQYISHTPTHARRLIKLPRLFMRDVRKGENIFD